MVDKLVMLLSTVWFKAYWYEIGIEIDEARTSLVQQECQDIVKRMLSGAEDYHTISFSEQRKEQTKSELLSSIERARAQDAFAGVVEEWDSVSRDDLTAAWIYSGLTEDLLSGDITDEDPNLDPLVAGAIADSVTPYKLATFEFVEKCEASQGPWDSYIKRLTPGQPTALADQLAGMLTARRFRLLWDSVRTKLTPAQQQQLITWYREMAKSRGRREMTPSYMLQ
jgi:hypothetical protein